MYVTSTHIGEGEHKIMEYIRREKSQDGWDPNQRHCIYGNDADLIMHTFSKVLDIAAFYSKYTGHLLSIFLVRLSLATHEPHFALLRETTDFRPPRRNKDGSVPELSKVEKEEKNRSKGFQLLHISILRDYLELEFLPLAPAMEQFGGLHLERLVDDFVLLCYLIGTRSVPSLAVCISVT
jgi:5'-3' exoribonuclease 1